MKKCKQQSKQKWYNLRALVTIIKALVSMSVNSHALHPIQNVKEGVMRDLLWGLKDTKIDATIPFKGAFIT